MPSDRSRLFALWRAVSLFQRFTHLLDVTQITLKYFIAINRNNLLKTSKYKNYTR
jgi:hypothetical protein